MYYDYGEGNAIKANSVDNNNPPSIANKEILNNQPTIHSRAVPESCHIRLCYPARLLWRVPARRIHPHPGHPQAFPFVRQTDRQRARANTSNPAKALSLLRDMPFVRADAPDAF